MKIMQIVQICLLPIFEISRRWMKMRSLHTVMAHR